jgi:hypothetical protein
VDPQNQSTTWRVDYGATEEYGSTSPARALTGTSGLRQVSATLSGLQAGRLYHYRLRAQNGTGTVTGDDRVFVAGSAPGSDPYRAAVLATSGLVDYWRLGELSGTRSRDETSSTTGALTGQYVLGQPGVLGPLRNTSASFDGAGSELAIAGSALGSNATVEGWFRWRSGRTVLRDNTGPSRGWMPALAAGANQAFLTYRVGGQGFTTTEPIGTVRDGEWHHIATTKSGATVRLYVDGQQVHSATNATGSDPAQSPWHVMRNGTNPVYSAGEADELALYTRALTAAEVRRRYDLAQDLADDPLPANPAGSGGQPAGGGSSLAGDAPQGGSTTGTRPRRGSAAVRSSRLIVRGAPGVRNNLIARRRGGRWIVRDKLAALRPGARCRRLTARAVACRARGVRRILLFGGAGRDRLTVIGTVRVTFRGGPGRDVQRRLRR